MPVVPSGCLSAETLREFFLAWTELVTLVEHLKEESTGGSLIQFPKIPPSVSESLAARFLIFANVFPDAVTVQRGGGADVRVMRPAGAACIEVKGSGTAEFQTFGPKDYACDMLAWLRFGAVRNLGSDSLLRVTLFPEPGKTLGRLGTRVQYDVARAASRRHGATMREFEVLLGDLLV